MSHRKRPLQDWRVWLLGAGVLVGVAMMWLGIWDPVLFWRGLAIAVVAVVLLLTTLGGDDPALDLGTRYDPQLPAGSTAPGSWRFVATDSTAAPRRSVPEPTGLLPNRSSFGRTSVAGPWRTRATLTILLVLWLAVLPVAVVLAVLTDVTTFLEPFAMIWLVVAVALMAVRARTT